MDKSVIFVLNWHWIRSTHRLDHRRGLPLGSDLQWLRPQAEILVRYRGTHGAVDLDSEARLFEYKGAYYLQSRAVEVILSNDTVRHVYLVVDGTETSARIVLGVDDGSLLQELETQDPSLRLHAYDLPPTSLTVVDTPSIQRAIRSALQHEDPELHSDRTKAFVHYPHILLSLLSHVMELKSEDQISFVSKLRVAADQLRDILHNRIVKLAKCHHDVWHQWSGRKVSFVDGGVARVAGLPGSEPLAMRVGIYTVTPGETNLDERETWMLLPYVVGDIINVPMDPEKECVVPPDQEAERKKRLQEAARYILEALVVLWHAEQPNSPDIVFLHGPLVNSFLMYDEGEPHCIPGVDPDFLTRYNITDDQVLTLIQHIPTRRDGTPMWNQCMAVYGYLMRRLFSLDKPVVGVVERAASTVFRNTLLTDLVRANEITESYATKLRRTLDQYRIGDELLFGCVLDEGAYITPITLEKNPPRRARDRWQPVVSQYPSPLATYLKTSESSFPYRVEFNHDCSQTVMSLLYHTSRLLPEYAFPVGLDIADKYARVPDWISRGISASIAAQVLAKAAATGEARILQQVRRLLAHAPRDFYFRPRVQ